uniref:ABC transporter domain-containing protein n=1 Tax=Timema monikensis TaxID=170555 RepID=A0A7R9HJS4_9NEOP|nr:unnamed protein product [Timema monikensis]
MQPPKRVIKFTNHRDASLVLTYSSQLTADGFKKLPDQIMYPYAEPNDLQKHVFSSCMTELESMDVITRRRQLRSQNSTVFTRRQHAVCVRSAFKHYGTKKSPTVILDGLNMTVPKGCIYGLLGASGCGKTTLLSCIVGRRRLKAGDIWVLGGRPGSKGSGVPGPRIGYMPQVSWRRRLNVEGHQDAWEVA